MIKRENIQRMVMRAVPNGEGGKNITYDGLEFVQAYVSVLNMTGTLGPSEYGSGKSLTISVVTDYYLDEGKNIRYKWNGKLFQVNTQQKIGNEWRSILNEVTN